MFDNLIFIIEILGTIAFSISGVLVAREKKMDIFGTVVLGAATAVGGGVLRDILAGQMPLILQKRIYAVAAIAGALIFYIMYIYIGLDEIIASLTCMVVVVLIRHLAMKYEWNLPSL